MAQMTVTPVATHAFLLDGKWIEGGDELEIRAPYDGSVVGRVFQGRREHADAAIAAAVKAFADRHTDLVGRLEIPGIDEPFARHPRRP